MQKFSDIDVYSLIIHSAVTMSRCFKKEQKSHKALLRGRSIYARKLQLHRDFIRVRSIADRNWQLDNGPSQIVTCS